MHGAATSSLSGRNVSAAGLAAGGNRCCPGRGCPEILARVGPPEGSTWHLVTPGPTFDRQTAIFAIDYASGLGETLILRLVDQGGWKISEVRTSIDRAGSRTAPWRIAEASPAPPRENPGKTADIVSLSRRVSWGGAVFALLLGGLGAWFWLRKGRRPLAMAAAACGAAAAISLGGAAPGALRHDPVGSSTLPLSPACATVCTPGKNQACISMLSVNEVPRPASGG